MNLFQKLEFYQNFLNPANGEQLRKGIETFRTAYGENWRKAFITEYPNTSRVIELCADSTAEEAYMYIADEVFAGITEMKDGNAIERIAAFAAEKNAPALLENFRPGIYELHKKVRAEIDKPR